MTAKKLCCFCNYRIAQTDEEYKTRYGYCCIDCRMNDALKHFEKGKLEALKEVLEYVVNVIQEGYDYQLIKNMLEFKIKELSK